MSSTTFSFSFSSFFSFFFKASTLLLLFANQVLPSSSTNQTKSELHINSSKFSLLSKSRKKDKFQDIYSLAAPNCPVFHPGGNRCITDQLRVTSHWCVAWVSRPVLHHFTSRTETSLKVILKKKNKSLKRQKNKGRVILKTENDLRNRQTNNVQARRVIWKKKQNPHKSKSRNNMQAETYWRRNKSMQNQI